MFRFFYVFFLLLSAAFATATQEGTDVQLYDTSVDSLLLNPAVVGALHLNDPEYLPPELFRDRVLRRDLALLGSRDSVEDPIYRSLMAAAVLYYDHKWDSAYNAYAALRPKAPDRVQGQLLMRLAKCRLEQGRYAEVRQILLSWQSLRSNLRWWEQADRILLDAILRDSTVSVPAKADSVLARLKANPSVPYARLLRLRRSQLLEASGNVAGARDMYLALLASGGSTADSAFRELHRLENKLGMPPKLEDQLAYARQLCRKGYHSSCLEKNNFLLQRGIKEYVAPALPPPPPKTPADSVRARLTPSTLDLETRIQLWSDQAKAWQGLEKNDSAIVKYRFLLDSVEYRSNWLQALTRLVRKTGKKKEAATLDSIFQLKFPFSAENANSIWVQALEYEQEGQHDSASILYARLTAPQFSGSPKQQWARFRVGLIHFKNARYSVAAQEFAKAANERLSIWSRNAALFFHAECLRMQGLDSQAVQAYLATIADFPLAYYAHRSRQNLRDLKLLAPSLIPQLGTYDMPPDSTIAWLRAQSNKRVNKDTTFSAGRVKLVGQLLRAGFNEEAMELYEESRRFHAERLDFLYEYGNLFMQSGEVALGFRLAREFLDKADKEILANAPRSVLRFLYPLPYRRQVVTRSSPGLDPLFAYAVMRQESTFNAQISSPVGARGLLQIMPRTGLALAKQENLQGFSVDLLYNPFMNIRLGTRYLRDLLIEYNNDPMYVLANYNAGPAPARRWQKTHAQLPWDLRTEDISYWETRDYVKKVMGNYWTYRAVWNTP
jgi:soluble lytic murein transglycosylase